MCLFLIPGLLPPPRAPTRHEHVGSLSWPPSSGRIGTLVHVPSLHVSWLHVSWLPASLFCAWGRCSGWNRVLYVLAGTQPLSHTPSLLLHSLIVSEQPIGWVNRRFIYPTSWCLTFVGGVYVKQVVWTKDTVFYHVLFSECMQVIKYTLFFTRRSEAQTHELSCQSAPSELWRWGQNLWALFRFLTLRFFFFFPSYECCSNS